MAKPIRVLQVVPILGYGGVEKIVTRYFDNIDHSKVMFDFVAHGDYEPYHDRLTNMGCKIYYLPTLGKAGYKGYKKAVKEQIPLNEYDIIHIHIGHITGLYASVFRLLCNAKIICHAHTTKCMSRSAFLMPAFRAMSVVFSNRLLACGRDAGKFCFGGAKFDVVPNAISLDVLNSVTPEQIDTLKSQLKIDKDTRVIGHIGHFSSPKNHPFLMAIIRDYVKKYPNTKFVLVGDGPDKSSIELLADQYGISDSVIFTGVRTDALVFMKMFDVFLLPSLHEGLPLVGIEAQAAGTPCVFSNTIDKTVDAGVGIAKFLPIDNGTDVWVEEINNILIDGKKLTNDQIYNGFCNSGYEISVATQKLLKIYQQLS